MTQLNYLLSKYSFFPLDERKKEEEEEETSKQQQRKRQAKGICFLINLYKKRSTLEWNVKNSQSKTRTNTVWSRCV